ncbi:MAG: hypothetical protein KA797_07795 [Chitinophagales bacterium]|nr:hypothetical protein [Chitinophagales bacterium]
MKTYFTFSLAILFSFSLLSCKKESSSVDAEVGQHHEDATNLKSEFDNTNSDVNTILNEVNGFKKKGETFGQSICGATIDSSKANASIPTLYINFDGTTICMNPARIRSGQIQIELIQGKRWSDKGAVLKVSHNNYKVKFTNLNNRSFTINGFKTLTNVDGFNWLDYFTKGSISFKYLERANDMIVTFEDASEGKWNIAREVTWTYTVASKEISVRVTGDSTSGSNKVESWGINRYGNAFTTRVSQPWESNSTCGGWKPIKGKYIYETSDFNANITLGTDASGNQVSSGCASSFKINWSIFSGNKTGSAIINYW